MIGMMEITAASNRPLTQRGQRLESIAYCGASRRLSSMTMCALPSGSITYLTTGTTAAVSGVPACLHTMILVFQNSVRHPMVS